MSQLMSQMKAHSEPLPQANRTLPPIPVKVTGVTMGLNYESWPHGKNDVAFGWSRKPTVLEMHRAGRVYRILPRRIPGNGRGDFFLSYGSIVEIDGWLLREKFLAVRTPEEALSFLRETGPFVPLGKRKGRQRARPPVEITFSEIQVIQRAFKYWLTSGPIDVPAWAVKTPFLNSVMPRWVEGLNAVVAPEWAWINARYGLDAIWATILLDYAWGAKFRCCRRHDCGQVFRVRDPRQVYCSYRCAHLVVVRNSRKSRKRARRSSR